MSARSSWPARHFPTDDVALSAELGGLLGAIEMLAGSLDDGFRTCTAAAESIAAENPDRAAWMLATAGMACCMAGRVELAHETTLRAYELARRAGGVAERIVGIQMGGVRLYVRPRSGGRRARVPGPWPEALDERLLMPGAPHVIGLMQFLSWVERYEDADAFAAQVEALASEAGAVGVLPLLRAGQLEVDVRRGDWAIARARASEALRLGEETGQIVQRSLPRSLLARIEAAMGLEAECRASVRDVLGFSLPAGLYAMNAYSEAALGLLELGLGRAGRAAEHLDEAARLCAELRPARSERRPAPPDRIEAHIRAGDPERAEAALREFEAMAVRTRRPWVLATAARCRGLLADDFDTWFERAYEAHGAVGVTVRDRAHRALSRRAAAARAAGAGGARAAALRARALRGAGRGAVGRAGARRAASGGRARRRSAGADDARPDAAGARGGAGGGEGRYEPRGSRRAVREPEDHRGAPVADLPEVGGAVAHRACGPYRRPE